MKTIIVAVLLFFCCGAAFAAPMDYTEVRPSLVQGYIRGQPTGEPKAAIGGEEFKLGSMSVSVTKGRFIIRFKSNRGPGQLSDIPLYGGRYAIIMVGKNEGRMVENPSWLYSENLFRNTKYERALGSKVKAIGGDVLKHSAKVTWTLLPENEKFRWQVTITGLVPTEERLFTVDCSSAVCGNGQLHAALLLTGRYGYPTFTETPESPFYGASYVYWPQAAGAPSFGGGGGGFGGFGPWDWDRDIIYPWIPPENPPPVVPLPDTLTLLCGGLACLIAIGLRRSRA